MTNGFYDTSCLKTKKQKKDFIMDAMMMSHSVLCHSKYKKDGSFRDIETESSISEYLEDLLNCKDTKLDCIDRILYNRGFVENCDCEISLHSTSNKKTGRTYWRLLYCLMNQDNLNKLVEKYRLKLKEW